MLKKLSEVQGYDERETQMGQITAFQNRCGHIMNKIQVEIRLRIENQFDDYLHPIQPPSDESNICRLYSPDVNIFSKLS